MFSVQKYKDNHSEMCLDIPPLHILFPHILQCVLLWGTTDPSPVMLGIKFQVP